MEKVRSLLYVAASLFLLFILFTVAMMTFDLRAIGPEHSVVGMSAMNKGFADFNGVNMFWYHVTQALGILAILIAGVFACLGLAQLFTRRSLAKVDSDLIALGAFYVIVLACYLFFEKFVVNYRPVVLDEGLEASYPSSHTVLAVCILGSAIMQFRKRIRLKSLQKLIRSVLVGLMLILVLGRLVSGVHWISDIIGGVLLAAALLTGYAAVEQYMKERRIR